jgi:ABC-type nitrate/sulfonate/bicarbonate transport system substrate-binding protein
MVELLTIMERKGYWEKHGVDVRSYEFEGDTAYAEERLFSGEIDFIFGNHVSPYMRIAQGHQMVCLAQTVNRAHIWLAAREEILSPPQLTGKTVIGRPLFYKGKFTGHGNGNRILYLEKQGINTDEVNWLDGEELDDEIEAVKQGVASACVINPRRGAAARAAGLRVFESSPLPMIHNLTYTSLLEHVQKQPEVSRRVIQCLLDAVDFFVHNRDETIELLKKPCHSALASDHWKRLETRYELRAAEYDLRLFPSAEAILNVYDLACRVYPTSKEVEPLELWDLRPLREVLMSRKKN